MNILTRTIIVKLVKMMFENVVVPMATEYVNRTDNEWDNRALDFLISVEKYVITKLTDK